MEWAEGRQTCSPSLLSSSNHPFYSPSQVYPQEVPGGKYMVFHGSLPHKLLLASLPYRSDYSLSSMNNQLTSHILLQVMAMGQSFVLQHKKFFVLPR